MLANKKTKSDTERKCKIMEAYTREKKTIKKTDGKKHNYAKIKRYHLIFIIYFQEVHLLNC